MDILVAIVGGFASGIFLRSLFNFGWSPIVFVVLIAGIFAGARFFAESRRAYSLGAVFCIFIALGMMRAMIADTPLPAAFAGDLKHRVSYEGVVVSDPDVRDSNQRVEVRISHGDWTATMLVVAPRSPSVMVGDTVRVSGTLAVPEPFTGDTGRIFRYDKYLQRDDVRFMLNYAYLRVTKPAPWYSIPAALARVKHSFLNGLNATLPEPYSSLAGGVVIGGKTGLGNELQDAFVRSGLVQIIVLSGYNIMVVAEWIMAALALTPLSRRWGTVSGALAVFAFVGIAGASSTAIRAMLMAFIALYARATGRTYAAGRALLAVVFLMLIWNPLYLVFDPGFGLSVVATAGLIWLAPIIERILDFVSHSSDEGLTKSLHGFWKNVVATTFAAQIAVLPLLLYDMGLFSIVAIPANIIVAPLVPLAMGLSAIAGFAGMIFGTLAPTIGIALAFPAYLANAALIAIACGSAALPFSAFTLPPFPFWLVLAAYAALIYIAASKRFSTKDQLMLAKNASI
ncbi:MAG: ComEC/Rec2 family competence protein [Candidatus Paceibacterota bacterium]|jgi:competence protein ComEC